MEKRGEFFDYDPLTGLEERYEETADGKIHLHTYQDVEPALEKALAVRNQGMSDDAWRKQGVATYAEFPLAIAGQMMRKGIKVFDPNHLGAVVREINQNYPYFKCTDKNHMVNV